ncbi:MAG: molybdopterin-dependent oxidoreductase [Nitrospirae bacterium]|nr:molybdopterin-dependent oxidoreductase [Nitrospirota bacterium]
MPQEDRSPARPTHAAEAGMDRRDFLKVAATAAAVTACVKTEKKFVSPIAYPADYLPDQSRWINTTCHMCSAGCGIQVRVFEGNAKKIEGNPLHPVSHGRVCARGQAGLQLVYNPDRLRAPLQKNGTGNLEKITWDEALKTVAGHLKTLKERGESERIYIVTSHVSGARKTLLQAFLKEFGAGADHLVVHELLSAEPLRKANQMLFDRSDLPVYNLAESNFVLSFGADLLGTWLSPVHYTHAYGEFRQGKTGRDARGRLVHVEPRMSLTAANADTWIAPKPGTEVAVALAMAHVIVGEGLNQTSVDSEAWKAVLSGFSPERVAEMSGVSQELIVTTARDLARVKPACVIAGSNASTNSTALAMAAQLLNWLTGNLGESVRFDAKNPWAFDSSSLERSGKGDAPLPSELLPTLTDLASLSRLKDSLESGQARVVLFIDTNPVFTLPERLGFAKALEKADLRVFFGHFMSETAELCHVVLPMTTHLESWWDSVPAAPVGSTVMNLARPVIQPSPELRQPEDVLLGLMGELGFKKPADSSEAFIRDAWKKLYKGMNKKGDVDAAWTEAVAQGGWWQASSSDKKAAPSESKWLQAAKDIGVAAIRTEGSSPEFPFAFYPYASTKFYDGRHANLPWLQELADPLTTVVWGSWVELHPDTVAKLGLREGDIVRVESVEGAIEGPVLAYPGIRRDTVAFPIGQGHQALGRYARGRGANPIQILSLKADAESGALALAATAVKISPTGRRGRIVRSQGSPQLMGTEVLQTISAEKLQAISHHHAAPKPLHGEAVKWGMTVDLDKCTGCGACMVACSSENNIPVVGEESCAKRRNFSWIRVERYWPDEQDRLTGQGPGALFLVMMCQHCENAPCEPVCPVYATNHNQQGLNVMVYDRCVGTRYCSNNCPYKVRYFNWYEHYKMWESPLELQHNPDVRIRVDGVMEKCTFCIQRIRVASDRAKDEGRRPVRDGEVVTACQQTCPADAIVFGNLMDPAAQVTQRAQDPRGYGVLEELNVAPSVTYLKKVTV